MSRVLPYYDASTRARRRVDIATSRALSYYDVRCRIDIAPTRVLSYCDRLARAVYDTGTRARDIRPVLVSGWRSALLAIVDQFRNCKIGSCASIARAVVPLERAIEDGEIQGAKTEEGKTSQKVKVDTLVLKKVVMELGETYTETEIEDMLRLLTDPEFADAEDGNKFAIRDVDITYDDIHKLGQAPVSNRAAKAGTPRSPSKKKLDF